MFKQIICSILFLLKIVTKSFSSISKTSKIFDGLAEHRDFYFVNSFHCNINDKNLVIAETEYEEIFCSAFQKENIIGVQFHPEKSQKTGQILIKNFLSL